MSLEVQLLGNPQVLREGQAVKMDTRKAVALLAYLAVTRQAQSREFLSGLMWPESDHQRARGSLRRTLSTLRKAIGANNIAASRAEIALRTSPDLRVDVWDFDSTLDAVQEHAHVDDEMCSACLEHLQLADSLYRGDFMEGFALKDSYAFDEWQFFETERVRRRYAGALEMMTRWLTQVGNLAQAISYAQKWLAMDRLHEPAHQLLMRLYALNGQRTAALRQYRQCTRILEDELGVEPLEETRELNRRILEGDALRLQERPRSAIGRAEPAPSAPTSPGLVGRETEFKALQAAYRRCLQRGQVIGLVGEAGIGKTHLASEFLDRNRNQIEMAIACRVHRWENNRPYGALVEGLRAAMREPEAEKKLGALSDHWLNEAARMLPELISINPNVDPAPFLEGPGAQGRVFEALRQVILTLCRGNDPGVIWFDDLNWIDQTSLDFIGYLARNVNRDQILMVLCWRDMGDDAARTLEAILGQAERRGYGRIISLERFDRETVTSLAASRPDFPARFHQTLFEISEGLPLFVVEYLALTESTLQKGPEEWPIPQSALELERARLSALNETDHQIISTAAVIGRSFDFKTLRGASGRAEDEVISGLEQLLRHRLIREAAGDESPAYDFHHGILREVVYRDISLARRRLLHKRVARALATANRRESAADDLAAITAHHFRMAGEDALAAEHFVIAGENARQMYANHEALEHFQAALALGHPGKRTLYEAIGDLLTLQGDYASAISNYEAAAAQADPDEAATLEHKLGNLYQRSGDWELALAYHQSALESVDKGEQGALRAAVLADLAYCTYRLEGPGRARDIACEALELASTGGHPAEAANANNVMGILARANGSLSEAQRYLEASLEITRDDRQFTAAHIAALNNLALIQRGKGDIRAAIENTEEALSLCQMLGDRHREAALLNHLADLHHELGQDDRSMNYLRQAVVIFSDIGIAQEKYSPGIWMLADW